MAIRSPELARPARGRRPLDRQRPRSRVRRRRRSPRRRRAVDARKLGPRAAGSRRRRPRGVAGGSDGSTGARRASRALLGAEYDVWRERVADRALYPPEELRAIAAGIRAECDAALARLATVDPETLPPDLRAMYEEAARRWSELRALTEDEALSLHEMACLFTGRELTPGRGAGAAGEALNAFGGVRRRHVIVTHGAKGLPSPRQGKPQLVNSERHCY